MLRMPRVIGLEGRASFGRQTGYKDAQARIKISFSWPTPAITVRLTHRIGSVSQHKSNCNKNFDRNEILMRSSNIVADTGWRRYTENVVFILLDSNFRVNDWPGNRNTLQPHRLLAFASLIHETNRDMVKMYRTLRALVLVSALPLLVDRAAAQSQWTLCNNNTGLCLAQPAGIKTLVPAYSLDLSGSGDAKTM